MQITTEQWVAMYRPIKNHLDENASWDGCMFETHGQEIGFVQSNPSAQIWTLLDCDGRQVIASGFHRINRIGYFVTHVGVPADLDIEVVNDSELEEVAVPRHRGTPELLLVTLSNMDVSLFLNSETIMTLDGGESGTDPKVVGDAIARQLGISMREVSMEVPKDSDWCWSDVIHRAVNPRPIRTVAKQLPAKRPDCAGI